jgi:hypothetical protein
MGVKLTTPPWLMLMLCEAVLPFFGMFLWRDAHEKNLLSPLSL